MYRECPATWPSHRPSTNHQRITNESRNGTIANAGRGLEQETRILLSEFLHGSVCNGMHASGCSVINEKAHCDFSADVKAVA